MKHKPGCMWWDAWDIPDSCTCAGPDPWERTLQQTRESGRIMRDRLSGEASHQPDVTEVARG